MDAPRLRSSQRRREFEYQDADEYSYNSEDDNLLTGLSHDMHGSTGTVKRTSSTPKRPVSELGGSTRNANRFVSETAAQSTRLPSRRVDAPPPPVTVIPPNLNWLNVPDAVQQAFIAMEEAIGNIARDCQSLDQALEATEDRVLMLERMNDKLVNAVRVEQQKSAQLKKELVELQTMKPPVIKDDEIVERAVEELRKLFKPEEVRSTLKKVEIAVKQPQALAKRIESLEQFKLNSHARASATEQQKRIQRNRLDDAVGQLRKLSSS